jgi:hypothetical protein
MFKGRDAQLTQTMASVQTLGQHAVIYGERGVGKTSLSYVARETFLQTSGGTALGVRMSCSAEDTFASIWAKLPARTLREVDVWADAEARDLVAGTVDRVEDLVQLEPATPDSVARALHLLSSRVPLMLILDEFDRIDDRESARAFADLIKTMSDDLLRCSLVIVGVADDVDSLIEGHRSVERAIRQIYMPRMSETELSSIVVDGFAEYNERVGEQLHLEPEVVQTIVQLSQGFPYYTHLLAGSVGENAIRQNKTVIEHKDVFKALLLALENATQAIRTSYTEAIRSNRQDANYVATLLACALARTDELGFFAPSDIAAPVSQIRGARVTSANYAHHIRRFNGPPSWVLESRGEGRRARYRFHNPMMKPFILIKGVSDGLLGLSDDTSILQPRPADETP